MTVFSSNRIAFVSAAMIFRLLLDASYVYVISNVFSYEGFSFSFDRFSYIVSWIVFLLSLVFVRDRLLKVSDYFFTTALLAVIAPLTSLYGLDSTRPLIPVVVVVISIYLVSVITRVRLFSFKNLPFVASGELVAIGLSSFFVIFLVVWYLLTGVGLNLDFSKVYELRNENAELAAGGLLAYTNNWTYQIFSVFLMALSLFHRRYAWFVVLVVVQIFFFAASTHKTILFLPILLLGVWFYFRKSSSLTILPIMFSGVIILTLFSYLILDDYWLSSLFSRRVFYVPANLTFVYFEFFSENPKVFWSNSVLSGLISYPYDMTLTHVVGLYLGEEDLGANNGFVASGYAHAGLFGVSFYVLIIGLILRLINDISYNTMPIWLAVSLCIVPIRALLISSDLFTVMLTHGFIIAIILIYLVRAKNV